MSPGEVIVWDTSKGGDDDPVSFTSGIGDDSHRDPVGKVCWMVDTESSGSKYNVNKLVEDVQISGLWMHACYKTSLFYFFFFFFFFFV